MADRPEGRNAMGARYSDRFFGPQGAPGRDAPAAARVPAGEPAQAALGSHAVTPDEIDLVGGTAPPPSAEPSYAAPPGRPWHGEAFARVALVAALVIGAIGGAYGWDQWRDRQAVRVAQSTVDVAAAVSLMMFDPASNHTSLSVHLENKGPHAITVTGFTPLDPRLSGTDRDFEPLELSAGDDISEVVNFGLDCSIEAAPDDAELALSAHIRTLDGVEHEESFRLAGATMGYGSSISEQCSYYQEPTSFQSLYPEISSAELVGDDAVRSEVMIYGNGSGSGAEPVIESVEAPSASFDATWDGSYGSSTEATIITVTWSIEECANALHADDVDMMLNVRGSLPSEDHTSVTTSYPSPRLVAQLVRLSEIVC